MHKNIKGRAAALSFTTNTRDITDFDSVSKDLDNYLSVRKKYIVF